MRQSFMSGLRAYNWVLSNTTCITEFVSYDFMKLMHVETVHETLSLITRFKLFTMASVYVTLK